MPDSSLLLMHASGILNFMHNAQSGLLAYYHIVDQQGELDELEREEFFRLKKVQAKKKRDAADKDAAVIEVSRVTHWFHWFMRVCCLHCPSRDSFSLLCIVCIQTMLQSIDATSDMLHRFNIRHAASCKDNDCTGGPALHLPSKPELREVLLT